MKVYPTMLLKIKDGLDFPPGYPRMLLKNNKLSCLHPAMLLKVNDPLTQEAVKESALPQRAQRRRGRQNLKNWSKREQCICGLGGRFWELRHSLCRYAERAGRRLDGEARFGNKPNEPNLRCSKEIQGFRRRQTQASYPPCNLRVTPEKGAIFRKFKCRTPLRIARIWSVVYELQREIGALLGKFEGEPGVSCNA